MLAALLAIATIGNAAADARPVSIRDIVEVTDLSGLRASPDGRLIAFRVDRASIADNGYALGWYVVPADGRGAPRFIGDGGGALYTDAGELATQMPVWAPGSKAIYVRALQAGQVQIWRAPVDGSGVMQWTHDAANIRDLALGSDGKTIVYHAGASRDAVATAEQRAADDGVLVDASVDIAQPIVRGAIIDGGLASQRLTGDWFDRGNILWRTPLTSVMVPIAATDLPSPIDASTASPLSADSVTIDWRHNPPSLVVRRPVAAICATAPCRAGRIVSAEPFPDRPLLLVTTADAAQGQTLSLWRPGSRAARTLSVSAGLLNGGRDPQVPCAIGAGALMCVETSAVTPPRLVRIDLRTRKLTIMFDPNAALRARIAANARALFWQANGISFSAELLLPFSPKPAAGYPLVMNYYDCPGFLRGGLGDELPMLPLASSGVASLCINQPHLDSTKRNAEVDYTTALAGISSIIARLTGVGLIDRGHIGMSGLSFGSEIVMAVAERSDLLAAAAISTGQPEPGFYWFNDVAGRDTAEVLRRTWQVGDPETDPLGWKRISPALNVEKIHAPLLMQLPEQEARWSMELYSKLSRLATPVEMVAYANEPHIKEQPRHKAAVYARNLDWFRFWLQYYIDPSPAKADQYARWQALSRKRANIAPTPDRSSP